MGERFSREAPTETWKRRSRFCESCLLMTFDQNFVLPLSPSLDLVAENAAVCYQELTVAEPKWVVLEDTNNPNGDFEEISLDSPLAKVLIGKRVGGTVVIAPSRFQDRTAKILLILPKYVRRFQDSLAEMQVRFGAASAVESVRLGGPDDLDLEKGVQTILDSVKQR